MSENPPPDAAPARFRIFRSHPNLPAKEHVIAIPIVFHAEKRTQALSRPPRVEDAEGIWRLVRECKPLDLNSCYAYMLLCRDFPATCAVAEGEPGRPAAFVSGYIPPGRPDVLFVWQVAVDPAFRGRGLARSLIRDILGREACTGVRYIETTVSPSNKPSDALFQGLAAGLPAPLQRLPGFDKSLFGSSDHEEEILYRIGPFTHHPQSPQSEREAT
jgi:L-2,4-diaminobutyric acid acetyltransferase